MWLNLEGFDLNLRPVDFVLCHFNASCCAFAPVPYNVKICWMFIGGSHLAAPATGDLLGRVSKPRRCCHGGLRYTNGAIIETDAGIENILLRADGADTSSQRCVLMWWRLVLVKLYSDVTDWPVSLCVFGPRPTIGGKYCLGERKRYRSCNIDVSFAVFHHFSPHYHELVNSLSLTSVFGHYARLCWRLCFMCVCVCVFHRIALQDLGTSGRFSALISTAFLFGESFTPGSPTEGVSWLIRPVCWGSLGLIKVVFVDLIPLSTFS